MKTSQKIVLFSLILLLSNNLWAQKDVKFEIRHWLGNSPFAFNMPSQNNLAHDFNVTRLEYYISEISIVHDSGLVMRVPDTSFLINPSVQTLVDLGNFAVDQVEGISFHVGLVGVFFPALVMDLLGPSLEDLFSYSGRKFDDRSTG